MQSIVNSINSYNRWNQDKNKINNTMDLKASSFDSQ